MRSLTKIASVSIKTSFYPCVVVYVNKSDEIFNMYLPVYQVYLPDSIKKVQTLKCTFA